MNIIIIIDFIKVYLYIKERINENKYKNIAKYGPQADPRVVILAILLFFSGI